MKSIKLITSTIIIMVIMGATAHAQEQNRIGVGFGYSTGGSVGFAGLGLNIDEVLSPANIYVPMTFDNFRLEPEIGYIRSSSSGEEEDITLSTFQIGTGLFGLNRLSDDTNIYFGGRLGFTRQSSEIFFGDFDPDGESDSSTNFFIGPALGSEHMLGDHFSIGGEAQLLYTSIGGEDEIDESLLRTRATFFIRVHI